MDVATLEQRVRNLEIRCRRLTVGATVLGAALGGACLTAALTPVTNVVHAERFELVNEASEVRGTLEMDGATPRLVLVSPPWPGCAHSPDTRVSDRDPRG